MKNIIKNLVWVVSSLVALGAFFVVPVKAQAAVDLNCLSNEGWKQTRIANVTTNSGWADNSVTASPGDRISIRIHYHNFTATEVANNVQMAITAPTGNATSQTFTGRLWAGNSITTYSDTVTVNISNAQTLSFVPGSLKWTNNTTSGVISLPNGQSGDSITSSGINIGSVNYGEHGFIVVSFLISNNNPIPTGNAPIVTTSSATGISQNSANLNGYVNPNNSNTNAWFEYATNFSTVSNGSGIRTNESSVGSGNSDSVINNYVNSLQNNTTYYFRAAARNNYGTSYGSILSFNTGGGGGGCFPLVTSNSASFVTENSASLLGTINPNGYSTDAWFEYGTNSGLGTRTSYQTFYSYNYNQDLIRYLSNLNPNTTYYYQAVAQNSCGTSRGSILTFTTTGSSNVSSVNTLLATNVGLSYATLNGSVNPGNSDATAWFEYGTDQYLNNYLTTSSFNTGSGNYLRNISAPVSGLVSNTNYYFRAVARNSSGAVIRGSILTLRTGGYIYPPAPTPTPTPVSYDLSLTKEVRNITSPNGSQIKNEASVGDMLEYTLNVKNIGSATMRDITVSDLFPSGVEVIEASRVYLLTNLGSVTWKLNPIAPGSNEIIYVRVKVRETDKDVTARNTFSVSSTRVNKTSNETITEIIVPKTPDSNLAAGIGFTFNWGNWWIYLLWFLIILLILAIVYLYLRISKLLKNNY